jgi:NADH/NAD ratio-sensing transcriptional regulator Rex
MSEEQRKRMSFIGKKWLKELRDLHALVLNDFFNSSKETMSLVCVDESEAKDLCEALRDQWTSMLFEVVSVVYDLPSKVIVRNPCDYDRSMFADSTTEWHIVVRMKKPRNVWKPRLAK